MDPRQPRLAQAKEIFADALETPVTERGALLDAACASDTELRAIVGALLDAHSAAHRFMDSPSRAPGMDTGTAPVVEAEQPGACIGAYKLLEQIGEGGFGLVFMAEQSEPVVRRVALKVIKLGMDTRQVIARFEAERQALAMMEHPNIAKVLDAGATDAGRPYFVMELVRGDPITEYCDKNNLATLERLELFTHVCHAVQHAHQKGIIHRDIKPSNVLVTIFDGRPVPKVIDFGIAKAVNQRLTAKTLFTAHRQLIGTPEYMSPEQAEMSGVDIDTRSDIYSLGVLLYELLTGTTPFDAEHLRSAALAEVQRIIREEEPEKPSTRLSTLKEGAANVAARRRTEPARLSSMVRGDLDWIVMKCLEKDRTRRYETANGLAMDVMRHLAGEPVAAAPPSRAYRVRKFVRRNRSAVTGGALFSAALLAGLAGTTTFAIRESAARSEAERRRLETARVADFQAEMLSSVLAHAAGAQLMQDLRERYDAALVRGGFDEAQRTALSESFANELARINATDAAAAMIDRMILRPAVNALDRTFAEQPVVDATLRQTIEDVYYRLGLFEAAKPLQERALATRRRELGNDHPDTLESVHAMGLLLGRVGTPAEVKAYAREVVEGRRRVLGEDDRETIVSKVQFATETSGRGDGEVEAHVREILDQARDVLDEEDEAILACEATLSLLLQGQRKFEESEKLARHVMEVRRRTLGDDAPDTIASIGNVGVLLEWQGKFAEAEPFLREAVERNRRILGEDHRETIHTVNNLSILLRDMHRYDEALSFRREVLERRRRVLGPLHPSTLDAISKIGLMLHEGGQNPEAEQVLREAIDARGRAARKDEQAMLDDLNNLGGALQSQGRFAEAEPLMRECIERARALWGPENASTITYLNNMGSLFFVQGRLDKSGPYTREALDLARRAFGKDDDRTIGSLWNLGFELLLLGRETEAIPYLREHFEAHRRKLGPDDPQTLEPQKILGQTLLEAGMVDEAKSHLQVVLEKRSRVGPEREETLITAVQVGRLLTAQGKYADSEALLRETLATAERALPAGHFTTGRCRRSLGELMLALDRPAEAEELLRAALPSFTLSLGPKRWGMRSIRMKLANALAAQARFPEAEEQLLQAESNFETYLDSTPERHRQIIGELAAFYEAWEVAEPDRGHDANAREWRTRLESPGSTPPADGGR